MIPLLTFCHSQSSLAGYKPSPRSERLRNGGFRLLAFTAGPSFQTLALAPLKLPSRLAGSVWLQALFLSWN